MGYKTLNNCVEDLKKTKQLKVIDQEVDPYLEIAAVQRRVYQEDGPALLFTNLKGCDFPVLGNLFGNYDRALYVFRDTIEDVKKIIDLKKDPMGWMKNPWAYRSVPKTALHLKPKKVRRAPALENEISISQLPQIVSWPQDGGAFITLPCVYTQELQRFHEMHSNLGMYRIQISGNDYNDHEIGLHYQIHRGIGVHHDEYKQHHKPFPVNIFVGGTPAMMLASVMPLPEGLPEILFAGALAGHRIALAKGEHLPVYAQADFCIQGLVHPTKLLPEGPFGDHLGYYSLTHDFPVLQITKITHRPGAIWPNTSVGRPPQEDTAFGKLIHEITGPIIPTVLPGVKAVHAVDATGVHPLLFAIGSERYTPYSENTRPSELMTQAHAILGQGQLSLAKYLWIVDGADDDRLNINDEQAFIMHLLKRVDWTRDLHFITETTIDTLDYSGTSLNEGSKLMIAARGNVRRELPSELPPNLKLPDGFNAPCIALPGVLLVNGTNQDIEKFCGFYQAKDAINRFPLIVIVDDSEFGARTLNNFLWLTFTRSNPSHDIHGIASFVRHKHWGCEGSLVIDARIKPHHAAALEDDPAIEKRVDKILSG